MNIVLAKTAGFCFGVDRALNIVDETIKQYDDDIYTLGPIIHNPQIISRLSDEGVKVIDDPSELSGRETVVIRSHGISKRWYDMLNEKNIKIVDATCPYVAKIHRIVEKAANENKSIFIIGDPNHPEVIGIKGFAADKGYVFKNLNELIEFTDNNSKMINTPILLAAQTTLNIKIWKDCSEYVKKVYTNSTIFDTICKATQERQQEAMELAVDSDLMLVIGGRESSNTTKLFEICKEHCPLTFHIEDASEIPIDKIRPWMRIGVTAGASTPGFIIREVIKTMSEINNPEGEFDFAKAIDESFKTLNTGDRVKGVVAAIAPNEVRVDLGTKYAGYIPLSEISDDPNADPQQMFKVGDEVEVFVIRVNDVDGTIMLSKKKIDSFKGWESILKAEESGDVLEGVVTDVIKGGVIVLSNGVKVFIPASQATQSRNTDLNSLLRTNVKFKIIEVNKPRHRAVGSIKIVAKTERKAAAEKIWNEIEAGKQYTGVVQSIMPYGVFADLGGVDGMVHISELSWKRIKNPSEVVKVGDLLTVYIKDFDKEKGRISLGYKKSEDDPWELIKKYNIGDVVEVTIVRLMPFGAFAEIIPGIDGLIHISQISNQRVAKVHDVLTVGQKVQAKITEIDFEKKKINLSMKALIEETSETAAPEQTPSVE